MSIPKVKPVVIEEEKEEEAKEEDNDEDDPVRIVAEEIASLPQTPPNTIRSMEIASVSEIVSISVTPIAQSSPATSQL